MANNWDVQSFVQLHLQGMATPKLPGTEYICWETHFKKMYWAALVVQWLAKTASGLEFDSRNLQIFSGEPAILKNFRVSAHENMKK